MQPTRALTEQDLELLRNARRARSLQTAMNSMLALLFLFVGGLMSSALYTGVQFSRDVPVFTGIAAVSFTLALVLCFWIWRQRRRVVRPLHDAIERNQKRIVCGKLTQAEMLPKGRLRYTIDGEAVEVDLLLGVDTRMSHIFGRSLDSFTNLNDVAVELHCVALGPHITLLLQAHYPQVQASTRTERPTDAGDRIKAVNEAKSTTKVMLVVGFFVMLVFIGIGRSVTDSIGLIAVMSVLTIICFALILPFVVLPRVLRAYRSTALIAVEGVVTEAMSAKVSFGRGSPITVRWYRVGGVLYCPIGAGVEAEPAESGQMVKLEFMTREGRHGGGKLMYFETVAAPCVAGGQTAPAAA